MALAVVTLAHVVEGGAGRSIEASETWRVVVFLLGFNILSIVLELFLQSVSLMPKA